MAELQLLTTTAFCAEVKPRRAVTARTETFIVNLTTKKYRKVEENMSY
jgi:hypothetical protein